MRSKTVYLKINGNCHGLSSRKTFFWGGAWVTQLVNHPTLDFSSQGPKIEPPCGFCTQHGVSWESLSPSPTVPPPHTPAVYLFVCLSLR